MTCQDELTLLMHVAKFGSAYPEDQIDNNLISISSSSKCNYHFIGAVIYPTSAFCWWYRFSIHIYDLIFFVTYVLLGLEYMSIELDDPFGNDVNDFDNIGMAQKLWCKDIFVLICFQIHWDIICMNCEWDLSD